MQSPTFMEFAMATLAKVFSRASQTEISPAILRVIAIFGSALLLFIVLRATYGLDLSPGFF
jgi:hypothetical protein